MRTERIGAEQRAEMVATFKESGMSQRAFAELEGIKLSRLQGWLYPKARRPRPPARPRFVRVEAAAPIVAPLLHLQLAAGVSLQLASLPEPEYVARLHRALAEC